MTGKMPAMLVDAPTMPEGCEALWNTFMRLHRNRGSTGWGPARITDVDIAASRLVAGAVLDRWQLDVVNRADDLWLIDFAPKPKRET